MSTTEGAPTVANLRARWRVWLANILLLVFVLASVMGLLAISVRDQLLDTPTFVATTTTLASDPAVQEMAATKIADRLVGSIDFGLVDRDPGRVAQAVADPLNMAIETAVQDFTLQFLQSDEFAVIWAQAMETLHVKIIDILKAENKENVSTAGGQVTINLTPALVELQTRLEARGADFFRTAPEDQPPMEVVLYDSDNLAQAQTATSKLENWAQYLPIVALIALFLYFVVSYDRWSASITAGVSFAIAMALSLVAIEGGSQALSAQTDSEVGSSAADSMMLIVSDDLRQDARALLVIGVIACCITWLLARKFKKDPSLADAGPSRWDAIAQRFPPLQPSTTWVLEHRRGLIITLLATSSVLIAFWDGLDWGGWLAMAAAPAIFAVIIAVFVNQDHENEPEEPAAFASGDAAKADAA